MECLEGLLVRRLNRHTGHRRAADRTTDRAGISSYSTLPRETAAIHRDAAVLIESGIAGVVITTINCVAYSEDGLAQLATVKTSHAEQRAAVHPLPPASPTTHPRDRARRRDPVHARAARAEPKRKHLDSNEQVQLLPAAGRFSSTAALTARLRKLPHARKVRHRVPQLRPHSTATRRQTRSTNTTRELALSKLRLMLFAPTDHHGQSGCLIFPTLAAPVPVCLRCTDRLPTRYARLRRLARSPLSRGCPVPPRLRFPPVAGF